MALKHILTIGALACALGACRLPHLPTRTAEAEVKGPPPCPCAKDKAVVARAPAAKAPAAKSPAAKPAKPALPAVAAPAMAAASPAKPVQLAGAGPAPPIELAGAAPQRHSPAQRAAPQHRTSVQRAAPRRTTRMAQTRPYRSHGGERTGGYSGRYAVQGPYPVAGRSRSVYVEQRSAYESESFSESYSSGYGTVMQGPPQAAYVSGGYVSGGYTDGGYAQGGYAVERRSGPPRGYAQDRYGPPPVPCHC